MRMMVSSFLCSVELTRWNLCSMLPLKVGTLLPKGSFLDPTFVVTIVLYPPIPQGCETYALPKSWHCVDSSNVSCSETMSNCRPMPGICLGSISKSWSQKREKAAKLQGPGFASFALGGQGGPGGGAEVELHQNGPFLPLGLLHLRLHVPINQLCLHPKPSGYLFQLLLHILRCFFQLLLHIWNSGELRSYLGEDVWTGWKSLGWMKIISEVAPQVVLTLVASLMLFHNNLKIHWADI